MILLQALKFAMLSEARQLQAWRDYFDAEPGEAAFHPLLDRRWRRGAVPEVINAEQLDRYAEVARAAQADEREAAAAEDFLARINDPSCPEFWQGFTAEEADAITGCPPD